MIRRPPISTQSRSSAASDVYQREVLDVELSKLLAHSLTNIDVNGNLGV